MESSAYPCNIIINPHTDFLLASTTNTLRHLYYGAIVGLFFFCWFMGATYLSKASDAIGRKKALLICLYGLLISYVFTILSLKFHSLVFLALGRIIAGLTAGNQSISQAAVIDISTPETKSRYIGLTIVAFSVGMVIGPIIGGIFSNPHLSPDFTNQLPFYILLSVIVFAIILVTRYYHDHTKVSIPFHFRWSDLIKQFSLLITHRIVRQLSLLFFIQQFCFNTFYVFIAVYLLKVYHYSILANSLVLVVIGLSNIISGTFLVPKYNKMSSKTILSTTYLIMAISLIFLMLIHWRYLPYLIMIPFMMAFALGYTTILSLFSDAVSTHQQGWVMGITVSLFTLGAAITAIIGSMLMTINNYLPFIIVLLGYLICWLLVSTKMITLSEQ